MGELVKLEFGPTVKQAWDELFSAMENADFEQFKALTALALQGLLLRIQESDNDVKFICDSLLAGFTKLKGGF